MMYTYRVARQRRLAHPPIKEALIAIQLAEKMPESFATQLEAISLDGYSKKPIRFQEVKFEVAGLPTSRNELFGWRFESDDSNKVVQLRRDGIGFSIIRGYSDWDQIKSLTQHFWNVFLERAGAPVVNRLATRYINVVEVPIADLRFDNYLTAAPRVPDNLPQGLRQFLQRVEVPFGTDVIAIIIQTFEVPTGDRLPIILDIDVQMTKETRGDSPDIWTALDSLRTIKNDIFFSSVTERALEPYQ